MTDPETAQAYDRLPEAVTEFFGEDATAEHAYDLLTVDVPPAAWTTALETARSLLGCTYFDWLSAVDEPGTGFRVCAHVAAPAPGKVRRLLLRTTVPHDAAVLPTAVDVYAGAAWHERETHEMFGIGFEGHPHLVPLLLPEGFEGHPLRKDFVLAARVAKAWPGAKEPGESEHGGPKRRTMLPPGVPDPNEWGPLKGQLPPAPTRPARAARPAGDRPVRRARSVSEGSASQQPEPAAPAAAGTGTTPPATTPTATPRRTRSASQGSASQQGAPVEQTPAVTEPAASAATPKSDAPGTAATDSTTSPSAAPGTAPSGPTPSETVPSGPTPEAAAPEQAPKSRGADAPWHHARPAFDPTLEPDTSQPPRRPRSGGPEAEPPVREGADRGEAPRSGPTPEGTEPATTPETPEAPEAAETPETPDHPAGGDTA
ncbi:NADH-quinone oxidoreductase subunit C [Streptomyces sp. NBC_00873]|uniref:NADH-quinone oxidoreductase subunit C n=1 Tax=unclassified Streptomyces TaxID=2593676 RepID=UPI0038645F17|nr:NADH-quinone oxidoreductase subunit C [Streptomyces sp. NBC_00873]WTA45590.1 NADH-quinone oxidoreductase subunit C [Streptomyces sp. NBC_00842]